MHTACIAFVEILETKVDRKFEEKTQVYKDDIRALSEHIDKVFATKEDLAKLQTHIESRFNDQLKWMIVMWISQLAAIAGMIKMFIK